MILEVPVREQLLAMLGQEREHGALGDQMLYQRRCVQQLSTGPLTTRHIKITLKIRPLPPRRAEFLSPS